jgi:broad specificity phosphatase PhoE
VRDLYLVRHGQAQDGQSGMDRDFHLTEPGRWHAHALGRQLPRLIERLDAIYVSRLTRARETAEILRRYISAPVHVRGDLIEHGSEVFLMDCSRVEAAKLRPHALEPDGTLICRGGHGQDLAHRSVGGETLEALHHRARAA